jgi:hypothetical protein
MLPECWGDLTLIIVYDLREVFEKARTDRESWGRGRTAIYPLDLDHVALAFYSGGEGSRTGEVAA